MCKIGSLRALLNQRLGAAVEEICGLFKTTIAEYEEEIKRQRRLLERVETPVNQINKADVQQVLVCKEETPSEQQEWRPSVDQEDPEPPHIKEEQEELWSSQEGEQLPGPVSVKSDDDEEKAPSSQLQQKQYEENRVAEPPACSSAQQMERDPSDSETECSNDEWKAREQGTGGPQPASSSMKHSEVHMIDEKCHCSIGKKTYTCSECGKTFSLKGSLQRHIRVHTGEKPFGCSICGKTFGRNQHLREHLIIHTGEQPFSCSVCDKRFRYKGTLTKHMRRHPELKPVCDKTSAATCDDPQLLVIKQEVPSEQQEWRPSVDQEDPEPPHIKEEQEELWSSQEGEQLPGPVSVKSEDEEEKAPSSQLQQKQYEENRVAEPPACSSAQQMERDPSDSETECSNDEWKAREQGTGGPQPASSSMKHSEVHMIDEKCHCSIGKKTYTCSECGKTFSLKGSLQRHIRVHTGEKPFGCSICGKTFGLNQHLREHLIIHTGEEPFSCSVCDKRFRYKRTMRKHMRRHPELKPVCDKTSAATCDDPQLLVIKQEVPSEQQEWRPSVDQEDPEPPHIKEEQEELWSSQEGEQLPGPVSVKSDDEEEKAPSSQLQQKQYEENRVAEPPACSSAQQMERDPSDSETECSNDEWKARASSSMKHSEVHMIVEKCHCSIGKKTYTCSECGKKFSLKASLQRHIRVHTGEKPFSCSICGKKFGQSQHLRDHLIIHTGEQPFSCSVCDKRFNIKGNMRKHMRTHPELKPVCDKTSAGTCGK